MNCTVSASGISVHNIVRHIKIFPCPSPLSSSDSQINPRWPHLMVLGWDELLTPSSNLNYPLRFDQHEGILENYETLLVSQWHVELKYGLYHQHNIRIMLQHAEPRARPFFPLNLLPSIYGADHYLWYPCA